MAFFNNASHFRIENGQFTSVGRDQTVIHFSFPRAQAEKRNQVHLASPLFEEYQTIRRGDMHFLRQHYANKQAIVYEQDVGGRVKERSINATRTASSARVLGPGMGLNYLAVTYAGEQGGKTWQDDFERFAKTPAHPIVAQLFGFNSNSPALVFHDDLIPFTHFWTQHLKSALAITYLHYRVKHDWNQIQAVLDQPRQNGLWLQPANGMICAGPQGTSSPSVAPVVLEGTELHCKDALLPLSHYGDDNAILRHFAERLDIYNLISECCERSGLRSWENVLPLRLGSILSVNDGQVVAEIPCNPSAVDHIWYNLEEEAADGHVLSNGWTRFAFRRISGSLNLQCDFRLPTVDHQRLRFSWLSQASFMFNMLDIPVERDAADYLLMDLAIFKYSWFSDKCICFENPIYLFLSPAIQRIPQQTGPWYITRPSYYWSFDPSDETGISAEGLSSIEDIKLDLDALQLGHEWCTYHYNALRLFQAYNGFDPYTQEHAQSLHYPLLRMIGDNSRFQEEEVEETESDPENEPEIWYDAPDEFMADLS